MFIMHVILVSLTQFKWKLYQCYCFIDTIPHPHALTRHQSEGLDTFERYLRTDSTSSFGSGMALLQYGSKMCTKFISFVSCKFKWSPIISGYVEVDDEISLNKEDFLWSSNLTNSSNVWGAFIIASIYIHIIAVATCFGRLKSMKNDRN